MVDAGAATFVYICMHAVIVQTADNSIKVDLT